VEPRLPVKMLRQLPVRLVLPGRVGVGGLEAQRRRNVTRFIFFTLSELAAVQAVVSIGRAYQVPSHREQVLNHRS